MFYIKPAIRKFVAALLGVCRYLDLLSVVHRGFIKVLNRRATEFDTWAKNWQGPEGLAPKGGLGACSPGKF